MKPILPVSMVVTIVVLTVFTYFGLFMAGFLVGTTLLHNTYCGIALGICAIGGVSCHVTSNSKKWLGVAK